MRKSNNFHTKRPLRSQWFSLTELMVVILIISLVVGLVGPAILNKYQDAQRRTAKTQIMLLKECAKGYFLDMNEYPRNLEDLTRNPGSSTNWNGPYIEDGKIPKDPWENDYHYETPGRDGRPFDIFTYGKDNAPGGDSGDADVGSWAE